MVSGGGFHNNKMSMEISPGHIFFGGRGHNNVGRTKTRSIKRQTVIVMEDFWKTVKDKFKTWKALFVLVIA